MKRRLIVRKSTVQDTMIRLRCYQSRQGPDVAHCTSESLVERDRSAAVRLSTLPGEQEATVLQVEHGNVTCAMSG